MKSKIKNNGWSFLAQFGYWGFSFLTFILLIRLLNKEDLGQWILYMSMITLIESLKSGFVQNGYIFLSQQNDSYEARLRGAGLTILMALSIATYIILFLFSAPLSNLFQAPMFASLMATSILYLLSSSVTRINEITWISNQNFKLLAYSKITYSLLFLLTIIAVEMWSSIELIYLPFLQFIAVLFCYFLMHWKNVKTTQFSFFPEVKKLLNYGKYSAGTNLTSIITNKSDTIFIGAFLGPGAVSLYNVASRLINVLEIPLTSISLYFYPLISGAYQQQNLSKVKSDLAQGTMVTILFFIPMIIGIMLWGESLVVLIAGDNYLESAMILKLLSAFILVKTVGRFSGITLDAIGKPKFNFYILLITLVTNCILNYFLIEKIGIIGVALATITTWIIGTVVASAKLFELGINIYKSMIEQIISTYQELKNHKNRKAWN